MENSMQRQDFHLFDRGMSEPQSISCGKVCTDGNIPG
jgi:hypothetical protein